MTQAGGPADEKHPAAPARLRIRLALPSWQTLAGIFGSSQRRVGAEAPEMLQSSPGRQLPPSISPRDPCAVPGAPTGSHLPAPAPTGIRFRWNLSSQPPRWLCDTRTREQIKVTAHPAHPAQVPTKQVREGRKSHANSILNIKILPEMEGEISVPTCSSTGSQLCSCAASSPALGHKISQGCSRCL